MPARYWPANKQPLENNFIAKKMDEIKFRPFFCLGGYWIGGAADFLEKIAITLKKTSFLPNSYKRQ
jgi:hypothetical protein